MAHSGVRVVNFAGGVTPQDITITDTPPNVIPNAAIFFAVNATGLSNSISQTSRISVGFADDSVTERCAMAFAEDGVAAASADAGYRIDNSTVVQISNPTNVNLLAEGNVTEFITNGCTISWSASANIRGQAIFFYGDDVESAVRVVAGNATENSTASITGLPFAPDVAFVLSADKGFATDAQGTDAMLSFGFAARTSDTQSCSCVTWEHQQSPTSSGVLTRDDACAVRLTSTAGTIAEGARLELTSWNSDGVEFTTRGASYTLRAAVLLLKMPNTSGWAGAPLFPASTPGAFSRTDPNFQPQALFFSGIRTAVTNSVGSGQGTLCVGSTDAYGTGAVGVQARDNQTTSDSGCDWSTTRCFSTITNPNTGTFDWYMSWTSFNANGWSGSVDSAAGGDRVLAYLAISHPLEIQQSETVQISEGVVFQQNPLRALSETEEISETCVFVEGMTGGETGVKNETVEIEEGLVLHIRIVFDETIEVSEECLLDEDSTIYDETEEISEGLVILATATVVQNETVEITEGNVLLITGVVLVCDEAVEISEETNNGPGPVVSKASPRGTTLSGGSEAGGLLFAGSVRGTTRG